MLSRLKNIPPIIILAIIIIVLLLGVSIGYQLSNAGKSNVRKATQEELQNSATQNASSSQVCRKVSVKKVEDLLEQSVEQRILVPDSDGKNKFSSCIFTPKDPQKDGARTAGLVLRNLESTKKADKLISSLKSQAEKNSKDITEIGNGFYVPKIGQLNKSDGAKAVTITVTPGNENQPDSKDIAIELADLLLK